jgi:hypothetical protein
VDKVVEMPGDTRRGLLPATSFVAMLTKTALSRAPAGRTALARDSAYYDKCSSRDTT